MSWEVGAIVSIPSRRMVQGLVFTPSLLSCPPCSPEAGGSACHISQTGPLDGHGTPPGHIVLHWRTHAGPCVLFAPPVAALHSVVRELGAWLGPPHCGGAEPGCPLHHLPSIHLRATTGRGPWLLWLHCWPGARHPGGHQTGQHRLQVRVW